MVGEIKQNNKHLINAPAGSGKTTYIREQLKNICFNNPKSKILCITYTNRAADELKKDLNSTNITVSTIHSYINDLISPFFSHKETLDLYWEIYGSKINERITNTTDEHIRESNRYYIDKYGELTEKSVRMNLSALSYGETPFTSLYSGKLSHDDLLMFANRLIKKYPVILRKIGDKYNYIFIDEYQDTSAYVLDIFYDAVKDREKVQLYLLGDKMQQIYRNYDGTFEEKLKEFDTSNQLKINFRSIGKIVSILNRIYNDPSFKQEPTKNNADIIPDTVPQIILSSNVKDCVCALQNKFPEILTLYLMNKEKYEEIGAKNLYSAYESMDEYSFGRKYSPTDVLSDMSNDNPDPLMKFLFLLNNIMHFYANQNYGMVISICKEESRYFNPVQFKIRQHSDKKRLKEKLDVVKDEYEKDGCLIRDIITCLFNNSLIQEEVKSGFEENAEYQRVLGIEVIEVQNLANYLSMPHTSTQHGVKGESHTSVIFVAADNNSNPNVRMYPFFKLWSEIDFSLPDFEDFFYSYSKIISEVEMQLGMKTSDLTAKTHNNSEENKAILTKYSNDVLAMYQGNRLFEKLCKNDFDSYLANKNVGNAKKIFKITNIEGILTAYKLFYVGCSRAKRNLTVVVDENKVAQFKDAFIEKARKIGFSVL